LERVCGYTDAGFAKGAKALVEDKRYGDRGYFFEPTVLVDTQPTMKVVREEILGPVVTAMPFDDLEDLVRVANDTVFGLAAGIWTRDISKAHRLAEALCAGTVWIIGARG
jgi:acyl-CoA reductase-like NAD-dependent aldehyde dehydrogenase